MTAIPSAGPAQRGVFARLSVMMLLEYATYGSWWATAGLILVSNDLGSIVGLMYSLAAVAAIVSLMFTGAIADRFFSSQKVLATLHAVGGVILLSIAPLVEAGNGGLLLVAVFVYMLFFQPTLAMTNNIAFTHIPEKSNSFAYIRSFGTAGWIIVGLTIGQSGLSASTGIFSIAAVMSFVLAIYSLTLPKTPPPASGKRFSIGDLVGARAFGMFRNRSFTALMVCILLAAVPISIYNSFGATYLDLVGVPNVASFLTIGQASEVIFLVLVPVVLRRFSIKWVLLTGLVAWVIRAAALLMMTNGNIPLAVLVIALHGVCNDFFIMTAAMYVNSVTSAETRAQAQSLFLLISFGIGNAVGSLIAGELYNTFVGTATDASAWNPLWYVTGGLTAVGAVILFLAFGAPKTRTQVGVNTAAVTQTSTLNTGARNPLAGRRR